MTGRRLFTCFRSQVSRASGACPRPRPAKQFPGLFIRLKRKALLHLPLFAHEGQIGLADTIMGAPGVFAVKQNVAPGLVKSLRWEWGISPHCPERFGLDQAFGG